MLKGENSNSIILKKKKNTPKNEKRKTKNNQNENEGIMKGVYMYNGYELWILEMINHI